MRTDIFTEWDPVDQSIRETRCAIGQFSVVTKTSLTNNCYNLGSPATTGVIMRDPTYMYMNDVDNNPKKKTLVIQHKLRSKMLALWVL